MKKIYEKPIVATIVVRARYSLLTLSENTNNANGMSNGSFGARRGTSLWDDEEEEY